MVVFYYCDSLGTDMYVRDKMPRVVGVMGKPYKTGQEGKEVWASPSECVWIVPGTEVED